MYIDYVSAEEFKKLIVEQQGELVVDFNSYDVAGFNVEKLKAFFDEIETREQKEFDPLYGSCYIDWKKEAVSFDDESEGVGIYIKFDELKKVLANF